MLEDKKARDSEQQGPANAAQENTLKIKDTTSNVDSSKGNRISNGGNTFKPGRRFALLSERCAPSSTRGPLPSPLLGGLPGSSLLIGQQAVSLQLAQLKAQLALTQINNAITVGSQGTTFAANSNTRVPYLPTTPPSPTAAAINLLNLLKIANTMSHSRYNPYSSGSQSSTQGQYGLPKTQADRDPRRPSSFVGSGSGFSSSGSSSRVPENSGQRIPSLLTLDLRPEQCKTAVDDDIASSVDMHISRAREEVKLQERHMRQPLDEDARLRGTQREEFRSSGQGMSSYPVSATSAFLGQSHNSDVQSSRSSLDWLSDYKQPSEDDSKFYSQPSLSSYESRDDRRFEPPKERPRGMQSIPGLDDYDYPVSDNNAISTESSRPKYSSESAANILVRFGLGKEDLEHLISYPEDQITPDNLPFILRHIRLRKAKSATAEVQSKPYPEHMPARTLGGGDSYSLDHPGGAVRPQERSSSSVHKAPKVIDYGHTGKYVAVVGDDIDRKSERDNSDRFGSLLATDNSANRPNQEPLQRNMAELKSSALGSSHESASSFTGLSSSYSSVRSSVDSPSSQLQTPPDQAFQDAFSPFSLPKKDTYMRYLKSEPSNPVPFTQPEISQPSIPKPQPPPTHLRGVDPTRPGLVLISRSEDSSKSRGPGSVVVEHITRTQGKQNDKIQQRPAQQAQPTQILQNQKPQTRHTQKPQMPQMPKMLQMPQMPQNQKLQTLQTQQTQQTQVLQSKKPQMPQSQTTKNQKQHTDKEQTQDQQTQKKQVKDQQAKNQQTQKQQTQKQKTQEAKKQPPEPVPQTGQTKWPPVFSASKTVSPVPLHPMLIPGDPRGIVIPPPAPQPLLGLVTYNHLTMLNSSLQPSAQPGVSKVLPSPAMMRDYAAASPRNFPHTCSLCNRVFSYMKDWINHQNTTRHLENCKLLRKQYPDWNGELDPSVSAESEDVKPSSSTRRDRSPSSSPSPRRHRGSDSRRKRRRSRSRTPERSRYYRRSRSYSRSRSRSLSRSRSHSPWYSHQTSLRYRSRSRSHERRASPRSSEDRRSTPRRSRERRSSPRRRRERRSSTEESSPEPERENGAENLAKKLLESSALQSLTSQSDVEAVVKSLAPALMAELAKMNSSSSSKGRKRSSSPTSPGRKRSSSKASSTAKKESTRNRSKERSSSQKRESRKASPSTKVELHGINNSLSHSEVLSFVEHYGKTKSLVLFRSRLEGTVCFEKEEDAKKLRKEKYIMMNGTPVYVMKEKESDYKDQKTTSKKNRASTSASTSEKDKTSQTLAKKKGDQEATENEKASSKSTSPENQAGAGDSKQKPVQEKSKTTRRETVSTTKKPNTPVEKPPAGEVKVEETSTASDNQPDADHLKLEGAEPKIQKSLEVAKDTVKVIKKEDTAAFESKDFRDAGPMEALAEASRVQQQIAGSTYQAADPNEALPVTTDPAAGAVIMKPPSVTVVTPLTTGEKIDKLLDTKKIGCIKAKTCFSHKFTSFGPKPVLISGLPEYQDDCYTEADVADLLTPFGFQETDDNIFVFPQANFAFAMMPTLQSIRDLLTGTMERPLTLKGASLSLTVISWEQMTEPLGLYKSLMKVMCCHVIDQGDKIIFIKNISPAQTRELRDSLKHFGSFKNFMPLLNKVFIEFRRVEDSDRFVHWFSLLKPGHSHEVHKLSDYQVNSFAGVTSTTAITKHADGYFLTPGEMVGLNLCTESIECLDEKACLTDTFLQNHPVKVLMITNLPAHEDGCYTEADVAELLIPFGFQYKDDNIYVVPQAHIGFVLMETMESVQRVIKNYKLQPFVLKGSPLAFSVVNCNIEMAPMEFYKSLMDLVYSPVSDEGRRTIFIRNISPSETRELRVLLNKTYSVKNFMPLLNKVFIEFNSFLDADRLGLWYSYLKRPPAHGIHRMMIPTSTCTAKPPRLPVNSLPDSEDILDGITAPSEDLVVPQGSSSPFWITMRNSPFVFPTSSPWFIVPKHHTVKELNDVQTANASAFTTLMFTDLPEESYKHEQVVQLVQPYFPNWNLHTQYYSLMVLPLQRRAFVFFPDGETCCRFLKDHIANPVSVCGRKLVVHVVFEDMQPESNEEMMYKNLMKWSNAGTPDPNSLEDRLMSLEISEVSVDVISVAVEVVASHAAIVNFLPLSNRICFEMADPSSVTKIVNKTDITGPNTPGKTPHWQKVVRFESVKSLKWRLQVWNETLTKTDQTTADFQANIPFPDTQLSPSELSENVFQPSLQDSVTDGSTISEPMDTKPGDVPTCGAALMEERPGTQTSVDSTSGPKTEDDVKTVKKEPVSAVSSESIVHAASGSEPSSTALMPVEESDSDMPEINAEILEALTAAVRQHKLNKGMKSKSEEKQGPSTTKKSSSTGTPEDSLKRTGRDDSTKDSKESNRLDLQNFNIDDFVTVDEVSCDVEEKSSASRRSRSAEHSSREKKEKQHSSVSASRERSSTRSSKDSKASSTSKSTKGSTPSSTSESPKKAKNTSEPTKSPAKHSSSSSVRKAESSSSGRSRSSSAAQDKEKKPAQTEEEMEMEPHSTTETESETEKGGQKSKKGEASPQKDDRRSSRSSSRSKATKSEEKKKSPKKQDTQKKEDASADRPPSEETVDSVEDKNLDKNCSSTAKQPPKKEEATAVDKSKDKTNEKVGKKETNKENLKELDGGAQIQTPNENQPLQESCNKDLVSHDTVQETFEILDSIDDQAAAEEESSSQKTSKQDSSPAEEEEDAYQVIDSVEEPPSTTETESETDKIGNKSKKGEASAQKDETRSRRSSSRGKATKSEEKEKSPKKQDTQKKVDASQDKAPSEETMLTTVDSVEDESVRDGAATEKSGRRRSTRGKNEDKDKPSLTKAPDCEEEATFKILDSVDEEKVEEQTTATASPRGRRGRTKTGASNEKTKKEVTPPRRRHTPARESRSREKTPKKEETSPTKESAPAKKTEMVAGDVKEEDATFEVIDAVEEEVSKEGRPATRAKGKRGRPKKQAGPTKKDAKKADKDASAKVAVVEETTYQVLDSVEEEETVVHQPPSEKSGSVKAKKDSENIDEEQQKIKSLTASSKSKEEEEEEPLFQIVDSVEDDPVPEELLTTEVSDKDGQDEAAGTETEKAETPSSSTTVSEASGAFKEESVHLPVDDLEKVNDDQTPVEASSTGETERTPETEIKTEVESPNRPLQDVKLEIKEEQKSPERELSASTLETLDEVQDKAEESPDDRAEVEPNKIQAGMKPKQIPKKQEAKRSRESEQSSCDGTCSREEDDGEGAREMKRGRKDDEEKVEVDSQELVTLDEVGPDEVADESVPKENQAMDGKMVEGDLSAVVTQDEGGEKETEGKMEQNIQETLLLSQEETLTTSHEAGNKEEKSDSNQPDKTSRPGKRKHVDTEESTSLVTVDEVGVVEEEEEKKASAPRTRGRPKRTRQTPVRQSTRGKTVSAKDQKQEEKQPTEELLPSTPEASSKSDKDHPEPSGHSQLKVEEMADVAAAQQTDTVTDSAGEKVQQKGEEAEERRSRADIKVLSKDRRDLDGLQLKRSRSQSPSVAADFKLPEFTPNNPLGQEFVVPKSGFFCHLCSVFYVSESTAKVVHCSSQKHYDNLKKHYERLQQKTGQSAERCGGSVSD